MEITRRFSPHGLELAIEGRLDAFWADHLTAALDEVIRGGADRLALDLSAVDYLSSAGIRALLIAQRELSRIGGALRLVSPSEHVKTVLEVAGLFDLLVTQPAEAPPVALEAGRRIALEGGSFEVWPVKGGASLECQLLGDPTGFSRGFDADASRVATFPTGTFGLGLGAFGYDFADCRGRFGEFLAVGGAAAYLPTDGTNVPDVMVETGALVPEVRTLYAVRCTGEPTLHARFEADADGAIPLSRLATAALDALGAPRVGLIAIAESAGLVGAALSRSPALHGEAPDLTFPAVRRWLSFTSERAFPAGQALVVGIAARANAVDGLDRFLRPMRSDEVDGDELHGAEIYGHFHAAAFSYRPLPRGQLELQPTVASLFETEALRGLLHLLHDDRELAGLGESEVRRGALWAAPIADIEDGVRDGVEAGVKDGAQP